MHLGHKIRLLAFVGVAGYMIWTNNDDWVGIKKYFAGYLALSGETIAWQDVNALANDRKLVTISGQPRLAEDIVMSGNTTRSMALHDPKNAASAITLDMKLGDKNNMLHLPKQADFQTKDAWLTSNDGKRLTFDDALKVTGMLHCFKDAKHPDGACDLDVTKIEAAQ
jgi:hypothetical protein